MMPLSDNSSGRFGQPRDQSCQQPDEDEVIVPRESSRNLVADALDQRDESFLLLRANVRQPQCSVRLIDPTATPEFIDDALHDRGFIEGSKSSDNVPAWRG
jgi:hypothetical protein